jgi:hypothetical protein
MVSWVGVREIACGSFFNAIKRCTARPDVEYRGRPLAVRRCHVIILKALLCIIVGGQIGIRSLYDKLSFVNLEKDYVLHTI